MKKKLISVLLAGIMVLSLAACGGGKSGSSKKGVSDDPNTLTVFAWDPSFNIPALKAAAADYQANVNKDFKLDIREQAGSSDVETAITTAASAGKYDQLPDIVLFQDHYIQKFVKDYPDAWQDVNDAKINWADFSAEKLSYSTINDKHYGVPVDNGTVITAYRVDLLEQAGYKMEDMKGITWDKFLEVGKAVKEKTGKYLLCMDGSGNDLVYMMMQAENASQFKDGKAYITQNDTLKKVVEMIVKLDKEGVLLLSNSWSDYTDKAIQGDQVAGVMNGNWIIPTMEKVEANKGKWQITSMPTFDGHEGYAANGGSSLYITKNCQGDKVKLAKDFLAYTFGGGSGTTTTYDNALKDGGVISCYTPAAQSAVYNEGVAFFNNQPIYAEIVKMGANVPIVEQNDAHYTCRDKIGSAIQKIKDGTKLDDALKEAEEQLNFEMEGNKK